MKHHRDKPARTAFSIPTLIALSFVSIMPALSYEPTQSTALELFKRKMDR